MPKITPFITYDHQAEEAVKLYTSVFARSRIGTITRYGEGAPMPKGTVMTIEFELDGQPLIALNGGPHFQFTDAFSLSVECETQDEVDAYTAQLTAGGGEEGPCGWVTDRFGLRWQITPTILPKLLGDQDRTKAARVMQAMLQMRRIDIAKLQQAYAG